MANSQAEGLAGRENKQEEKPRLGVELEKEGENKEKERDTPGGQPAACQTDRHWRKQESKIYRSKNG